MIYIACIVSFTIGFATCAIMSRVDASDWGDPDPHEFGDIEIPNFLKKQAE